MAGYVRWLQQYGAKAVPILFDEDINSIYDKMQYLNGILFPGGAGDYVQNGKLILERVKELNENGQYFPLWGTCLGIERFVEWTAEKEEKVLEVVQVKQRSIPIKLTQAGAQSGMFQFIGQEKIKLLEQGNFTYNWHTYGIRPQTFDND